MTKRLLAVGLVIFTATGLAIAQAPPAGQSPFGGLPKGAGQVPPPRVLAPPTNADLGQSVTQLREENNDLKRRLEALEARAALAEQKLQKIPVPSGACGSTGTWNLITLRDVPNERKWSTMVPVWQDCAAPPPR